MSSYSFIQPVDSALRLADKGYVDLENIVWMNCDHIDPRKQYDYSTFKNKLTTLDGTVVFQGDTVPLTTLDVPFENQYIRLLITARPSTAKEFSQANLPGFEEVLSQIAKQSPTAQKEYKMLRDTIRSLYKEGFELPFHFSPHIQGLVLQEEKEQIAFLPFQWDKDRERSRSSLNEFRSIDWSSYDSSPLEITMKQSMKQAFSLAREEYILFKHYPLSIKDRVKKLIEPLWNRGVFLDVDSLQGLTVAEKDLHLRKYRSRLPLQKVTKTSYSPYFAPEKGTWSYQPVPVRLFQGYSSRLSKKKLKDLHFELDFAVQSVPVLLFHEENGPVIQGMYHKHTAQTVEYIPFTPSFQQAVSQKLTRGL